MGAGFYLLWGTLLLVYGGAALYFIFWQRRIRRLRNEWYKPQEPTDDPA